MLRRSEVMSIADRTAARGPDKFTVQVIPSGGGGGDR